MSEKQSRDPNRSSQRSQRHVWFTTERLCLFTVILAAALAMSPNVADPDLWGHVQFGRDVLADGGIASTTSYSYTADGYRWINHENLSEIVMAVVVDSVGPLGLVIGKFLLSLFVIFTVLKWNLKMGASLTVAAIVTLLVASNLGYHWSIRPQIGSFVCFTMMILLLQYCFSGWRDQWHLSWPRRFTRQQENHSKSNHESRPDIRSLLGYQSGRLRCLWLAVPLFAVWANTHGGFVAGLCVFVAYLGLRTVEAMFRGSRADAGNIGWGIARRMILMAVVAILATFLNPYGPRLQLWLLESLGSPRPEISDWSNRELFSITGLKLWLLVAVTAFSILVSRRRQDATQLVVLALLFWQSATHFRHVPFFAIAAGFWIGPHLHSAMTRFARQESGSRHSARRPLILRGGLALALLLIGGSLTHRLSDLQVCRDQFPVEAIDFMRANQLQGRLVVTYDWAQYAIAALCGNEFGDGRSRVAFDGRFRTCYPQAVVDMHFDFLYGRSPAVHRQRSPLSPPIDPARVLNYGNPELVLLRRYGERTEQHMQDNTEHWTLLYQDAIAQVWGHRAIYDNHQHTGYLPPERRIIHNQLATGSVTWPAINQHRAGSTGTHQESAVQLANSRNAK